MTKAQILIVEDETIIAHDIKDSLQNLGYGVPAIVASGEVALQTVEKQKPDLVLMDIQLKGELDGVTAADLIRRWFDIPVVYLTAHADKDTLERAKITQPFGYLIKPFEERELHIAIEIGLYKHGMERKLKENRNWLAATLKSIGEGVIATDPQGDITFMNPIAESLTGWPQAEALGRDIATVFNVVNEETHRRVENPVTKALREGEIVELANHMLLIARDGSEIPIDDSAAPIQDDQGQVTGVVLVFRDVSERKRAEERLRASESKYRTLVEQASDGIFVADQQGNYVEVNSKACAMLGYTRDELLNLNLRDLIPEEDRIASPLRLDEVYAGKTVVTERRLRRRDSTLIPVEISRKMLTDGRLQGIVRDITRRKQTQLALQNSEANLRALFNNMQQSFLLLDRDYRIQAANRIARMRAKVIYGRDLQIGDSALDFVAVEDLDSFRRNFEKCWGGDTVMVEKWIIAKDKTIWWFEFNYIPIHDGQGKVGGVCFAVLDITERKRAEEAYRTLVEYSLQGLLMIQRAHIIFANPAATQILGYTNESLIAFASKEILALLHPEDRDRVYRQIPDLLRREVKNPRVETRIIRQDGRVRWIEIYPNLIEYQGYPAIQVALIDITERKQAEEALKESEASLAKAQQIAHLGNWDWWIQTEELRWSAEIYRIFGLTPQTDEATSAAFDQALHPDDREAIKGAIDHALAGEQSYNIDHRIIRPTGEIRIVHEQAEVIFDETGTLVRMIGTVQDITERKQLEARLAAIYQLGQELTLLHDEATIIEQVLKTATEILKVNLASCGLVDQTTNRLVYSYHLINGQVQPIKGCLSLDGGSRRGVGAAVVRGGEALYLPDVSQNERYVSFPGAEAVRSELCVPMKIGERVIGVLNAESTEVDCFSLIDQQLLQTLATQAAVVLENAWLQMETQRRARKLAALNKASRAMASSLDRQTVLERVMVEVKTILEVEGASVLLYNEHNDSLVFAAVASLGAERIRGMQVPIKDSVAGWVICKGQSTLVQDVQQDPRFYDQVDKATGLTTQSLLAVPLIMKEKVIGVIEVINKVDAVFEQSDLEILESLASSAAIAIENARLYEAERTRYRETETLRRAALSLTSTIELDHVLEAILTELQNVVPYDSASVQLLKGDHLEIIGGRGFNDLPTVVGAKISIEGASNPNGQVVERLEPLIIDDTTTSFLAFNRNIQESSSIRAWLGVPLLIGNRFIGMITLDKHQPDFYTQTHARTASAYAAQAAIAIENARLYRAEREQYRLLQQSQAQLIQVEKMAALGRLVASIAHEVNNPIQAVQNCLALIREELSERQELDRIYFYVDTAKNELERIATIVQRMREFYQPVQQYPAMTADFPPDLTSIDEFYRLPLEELQAIEIHEVLESVFQLANKQLQHSLIKVERLWAKDLPAIRGSTNHLKQVFLNMILNAIDAMHGQGGGLLSVRTQAGQVRLQDEQPQAAICVLFSDTGAGIPPEILSRIFEPLFTTKEGGSGFGLFTSYKIIEAMEGQINVESETGRGTTFTILLPAL